MPHGSVDGTSAPSSVATADEAALAGVLALSPDAILVVDAGGRIRAVNELAVELLGYDADELVGGPVEVLVPDGSRSGHGTHLAAFMARPVQRRMGSGQPLRAQRGDGSCFPADISLQPVVVAGEQLVVVAVRDLSRQRQLQRRNHELEEHAEALGRFVDVASHELRTPLSAIRGFAETLQRPGLTAPEQQAVLHGLLRNTRRQQAGLERRFEHIATDTRILANHNRFALPVGQNTPARPTQANHEVGRNRIMTDATANTIRAEIVLGCQNRPPCGLLISNTQAMSGRRMAATSLTASSVGATS